LDLQPGAIAIIPLRRSMDLKVAWQLDLCRPPQRFFENRSLNSKLARIVRVLIVTATTALKVRACRSDSVTGRLDHPIQTRTRESGLLLGNLSFDNFSIEHERNKDTLPVALAIGRKASKTFAAINEFFDLKLHGVAF
jgi:hypothetical protein